MVHEAVDRWRSRVQQWRGAVVCGRTNTDAAPYFRIFNSIIQGKKFDPKGNFIRC